MFIIKLFILLNEIIIIIIISSSSSSNSSSSSSLIIVIICDQGCSLDRWRSIEKRSLFNFPNQSKKINKI